MKKTISSFAMLFFCFIAFSGVVWCADEEAAQVPSNPQGDASSSEPEAAPEAAPAGSFTSAAPSSEEVPADQHLKSSAMGLDERVSLDLRNIEAADALRFLAQKG